MQMVCTIKSGEQSKRVAGKVLDGFGIKGIVRKKQVRHHSGHQCLQIQNLHRCWCGVIDAMEPSLECLAKRCRSALRGTHNSNFLNGHRKDNPAANLLRDLNEDLVVFDHTQITTGLFFNNFQALSQVIDFR